MAGIEAAFGMHGGMESRVAMIQMLIPFALNAVKEELLGEVGSLVGQRYSREQSGIKRRGSNPGSVYLGNQKVLLSVPRVRDVLAGCEIALNTYKARWQIELFFKWIKQNLKIKSFLNLQ